MVNDALKNQERKVFFLSFFLFFIFFISLPFLLRLDYTNKVCCLPYKVMWLNFIGADYQLPPEGPKPFFAFLNGGLPESVIYFLPALFSAVWAVVFMALSRKITGSYVHGIAALFLCVFGNREFITDFFLDRYWPIIYIPLIFLQLLLFLDNKYTLAFLVNLISSLIRPESWLYTPVLLAYLFLKKEKLKPVYFISITAPLLWMFFDYRISGDFLFSYRSCAYYPLMSAVDATSAANYWPRVFEIIFAKYSPVLLGVGLLTILFRKLKKLYFEKENIILIYAVIPFLIYWLNSFKEDIIIWGRFFAFSVAVLIFYASLSVYSLFNKFRFYKYLNPVFLALAAAIFFNPNLTYFARGIILNNIRREVRQTLEDTAGFFRENPSLVDSSKRIIIPARHADYYALLFGEKNSHKMVYFREVFAGMCPDELAGLAVCIEYDTWYYDYIKIEKQLEVKGKKYILYPLYTTSNGKGVIYAVSEAPGKQ